MIESDFEFGILFGVLVSVFSLLLFFGFCYLVKVKNRGNSDA